MNFVRQPVHIEPKGWGREIWIANNELYCGKILEIRKGKRSRSITHYHKLKTESFYLRSGSLLIRICPDPQSSTIDEYPLKPGDCMDISPGLVHQICALEDSELLEIFRLSTLIPTRSGSWWETNSSLGSIKYLSYTWI
jgi:hypothetical protein